MPNVRYVCLSDLHLGAAGSLFTDLKPRSNQTNPISPSPLLRGLAEILSEVLRHNDLGAPKPALILAGDFLELALCPAEQALAVARQFFNLAGSLFSEIIFVPGNHDHHLWEAARESQYLGYMRNLSPGALPEAPWSTTKVFMDMQGKDRLVCALLSEVAQRDVLVAYPNFGLRAKDGRTVIFHHGHFIEPAYRLMSSVMSMVFPNQGPPQSVYDLEKENAAWIDFLWSLLGNCGLVGKNVDALYEATGDESSLRALAGNLARSLAQQHDIPGLGPDWAKGFILRQILDRYLVKRIARSQERQQVGPLSNDGQIGFVWYFGDLLRKQIQDEAAHACLPVLVFGHTHKPFEALVNVAGYGGQLCVFNTGGWVVDTVNAQPEHGGSAVLVDEKLNVLNLRLYNENDYRIRVEEPGSPSDFYEKVSSYLQSGRDPWRAFSQTVQSEVELRAAHLAQRIRSRTLAA